MEFDSYCDNRAAELSGWRDKLDEALAKFDEASCSDKAKLVPQLNDLHMIKEELEERIERLETACLTTRKIAVVPLAGKIFRLSRRRENVLQNISPRD
jgi:predicted nuclease with TOPRIM domain